MTASLRLSDKRDSVDAFIARIVRDHDGLAGLQTVGDLQLFGTAPVDLDCTALRRAALLTQYECPATVTCFKKRPGREHDRTRIRTKAQCPQHRLARIEFGWRVAGELQFHVEHAIRYLRMYPCDSQRDACAA